MSGTIENATGTLSVSAVQNSPGTFQYTVNLTDTGTTTIGTFWFAWDDVPDQDFMSSQPTVTGSPAGWTAFVTSHFYQGVGTGYGIEWIASSPSARINAGASSSAFTFTSTETPTQMAAVSPFDHTFQSTSSFVYQGSAFATPGGNIVVGVACFRKGTRIRTASGDVPVERLRPGDHVMTAAGESRPIKWTGTRTIDCDGDQHLWPVRVAKHALDSASPAADLYLSPDHALFLDGVLVPVKHLINQTTIAPVPASEVVWYHLELDSHDVILAESAPAETYLDTGDRAKFDGQIIRLFAATRPGTDHITREAASSMELVIAGPLLSKIRRRLADRADLITNKTKPALTGRTGRELSRLSRPGRVA
jgi:hypothetical protein